jgi:hypothetical protein
MTLRDELRQWGLRKAFIHQFRLIAKRVVSALKRAKGPKRRREFCRPWRRFKRRAQPKPGLAAIRSLPPPAEHPNLTPAEEPFRPVNHDAENRRSALFRFLLS